MSNNEILTKLVDREVLMLASSLVEDLLAKELITYEEIENEFDEDNDQPNEIFEYWY